MGKTRWHILDLFLASHTKLIRQLTPTAQYASVPQTTPALLSPHAFTYMV